MTTLPNGRWGNPIRRSREQTQVEMSILPPVLCTAHGTMVSERGNKWTLSINIGECAVAASVTLISFSHTNSPATAEWTLETTNVDNNAIVVKPQGKGREVTDEERTDGERAKIAMFKKVMIEKCVRLVLTQARGEINDSVRQGKKKCMNQA
ncbi:hypothetical protein EI94DRAFT_1709462 [Lactarius quietus]|nr:hypothetical protein EI94DRAFT_1709462 [Lactarius quietus]